MQSCQHSKAREGQSHHGLQSYSAAWLREVATRVIRRFRRASGHLLSTGSFGNINSKRFVAKFRGRITNAQITLSHQPANRQSSELWDYALTIGPSYGDYVIFSGLKGYEGRYDAHRLHSADGQNCVNLLWSCLLRTGTRKQLRRQVTYEDCHCGLFVA